MQTTTLTITNECGLHSRPADLFVRTAKLYEASINVQKSGNTASAKSILKIILLNVRQGDEITITAEGPDDVEAVADLEKLITSDFTEMNDAVKVE